MDFHQIAIRLEHKAREILLYKDRPVKTIFDADSIECGHFIEGMILLLRIKSNFKENVDIDKFVSAAQPFLTKTGCELELSKAEEFYNEFNIILAQIK